jgi:hypothetical protein
VLNLLNNSFDAISQLSEKWIRIEGYSENGMGWDGMGWSGLKDRAQVTPRTVLVLKKTISNVC